MLHEHLRSAGPAKTTVTKGGSCSVPERLSTLNSQLSTILASMCGIAGQLNYLRQEPVDQEAIRRMADSIVHRGPDDEGYFFSGPLGFGFRRLSIIDLSGGHQPMSDADETVWVVFNGEIYNFKELRAELEQRGHQFRTNSDTEVIVHGYKQWGTAVLERLNGMFGLAIWDVLGGASLSRVTRWASSSCTTETRVGA